MPGGRLEGKVALVTGAGRGIGRAIALKLAAEGARLVINDVDGAPAEETIAEIGKLGGEAVACVGSVAAPDFGERFVNAAMEQFNGIDIIVNNAGYTWDNVIQKMSDEQFQAMLDVHLLGPFRILRAATEPIRALAKLDAQEGRETFRKIVNISSVAGTSGSPGQVNYSSAKMAIAGLTKSLAKEWGRYKVNVNAVAFGYIQTRLTEPLQRSDSTINVDGRDIKIGIQAESIPVMNQMIPLGRGGTPGEAAGAVFLLCIPESNYISGQILICAGGY